MCMFRFNGTAVGALSTAMLFAAVEFTELRHLEFLPPHSHTDAAPPVETGKFQFPAPVSGSAYVRNRPPFEIVELPRLPK